MRKVDLQQQAVELIIGLTHFGFSERRSAFTTHITMEIQS